MLIWLAVVGMSVHFVLTRRKKHGDCVHIVPDMAVFMLVIFTLSFPPWKARAGPLGERLGQLSGGALILFALVALGYADPLP